jgi:apolipoprotein N-acyltransferase
MKFPRLREVWPSWKNIGLAVLSAVLLIFAFPDFDFWFLAWFGLVPLFSAIEREKKSAARSFVLGWLWGFVFFTGTCWWLTFAPITYAGFPPALAYILLLGVTALVGMFSGLFAVIASVSLRRFGNVAILTLPFVWVFTEFLRYWITGNNWNAVGYSQAFNSSFFYWSSIAGVVAVSWILALLNAIWFFSFKILFPGWEINAVRAAVVASAVVASVSSGFFLASYDYWVARVPESVQRQAGIVVAIQPNVPMSGLSQEKWRQLRTKHIELAESALASLNRNPQPAIRSPQSTAVIFPESPMNFMWEEDVEFRNFVSGFAAKHDVQVLFNSAEPDQSNNKYFNSAVLVGPDGREAAQYDKIYLLPFGESVPAPLQSIVPAFVGSFSYGKEYDLLPLGDAKAGVMICFESHFGELGREYVRNGADVLIEMTNDGYLGPTPVLRQHLANAVFRAVETNRPVLRVTNVGITAYVTERGEVLDATQGYTEDVRTWPVSRSDGSQTFYVRYGDWFAWLCSIVTIVLLGLSLKQRRIPKSS